MADLDLDVIASIPASRGPKDEDRYVALTEAERDALVAEVRCLRATITHLNDTINQLAVLYEDQTGAPPHINTGVVEPHRG